MWSSSLPSQGHPRLDTGKDRHLVQPLLPSLSKEIRHLVGRAIAFTSVLLGFSAVTQHSVTWAALSLLQKPGSQAWLTSGDHRTRSVVTSGLAIALTGAGLCFTSHETRPSSRLAFLHWQGWWGLDLGRCVAWRDGYLE